MYSKSALRKNAFSISLASTEVGRYLPICYLAMQEIYLFDAIIDLFMHIEVICRRHVTRFIQKNY